MFGAGIVRKGLPLEVLTDQHAIDNTHLVCIIHLEHKSPVCDLVRAMQSVHFATALSTSSVSSKTRANAQSYTWRTNLASPTNFKPPQLRSLGLSMDERKTIRWPILWLLLNISGLMQWLSLCISHRTFVMYGRLHISISYWQHCQNLHCTNAKV